MFRRLLVMGALLLLLPLNAQALEFGARGLYWFADLDADIALAPGDTLDVDEVLDIGAQDIPMVEAFFGLGSHHFLLGWSNPSYDGSTVVADQFEFGGVDFLAGTRLKSDLDYTMIDFVYQWDFLDLENTLAGFSLGLVLQAKYLDGEATLDGYEPLSDTDIYVKEEFSLILPGVGLGAHVGILADILEARARIAGTVIYEHVYFDGQVELNVTPFPFMDIGVGYRMIQLDLDEVDDLTIDMSQKGIYASLAIKY